ncbi:RNA pyrophosphohydrolase [Wolbachia endosymbiont of Pentidionis agamae]|uniref:RNA pyrophosphohydrolase n=1 Tax=Wolbachia endosymbiont of Pentidionis agamae TaxID=3110435 RepID=UPI002FD49BD8
MSEELKYRPCVGIMLFNKHGHIFTGKRYDNNQDDSWQMPQGGVDEGENFKQAALRELMEETGISTVEIIDEYEDWIYYNLPKNIIPSHWNEKYGGQKQKWFLMRFLGTDKDINIHYTDSPEFQDWCWKSSSEVINSAIYFKKEVYQSVISGFYHKLNEYQNQF